MKKCIVYHTWMSGSVNGVMKDDLAYIQDEDGEFGLIQFEVEGKWGSADIYTGEISNLSHRLLRKIPRGTPSKGVKDNESIALIITI